MLSWFTSRSPANGLSRAPVRHVCETASYGLSRLDQILPRDQLQQISRGARGHAGIDDFRCVFRAENDEPHCGILITLTVILPASLRYRLPSETRVAVCLILGSVFVLGQEGALEGSEGNPYFYPSRGCCLNGVCGPPTTTGNGLNSVSAKPFFTPKKRVVCAEERRRFGPFTSMPETTSPARVPAATNRRGCTGT